MTGCQVVTDQTQCGKEVIKKYVCRIQLEDGSNVEESVGVCIIHEELMERQRKHEKGEVFKN